MNISINAPVEIKKKDFNIFVNDLIEATLGRFSHRVTTVNVTLVDENGPKGGVDMQCRITLMMRGVGQVNTSAIHENPMVAVRMAADRARRKVLTNMKRPQSLRVRSRHSLMKDFEIEPEEALTTS